EGSIGYTSTASFDPKPAPLLRRGAISLGRGGALTKTSVVSTEAPARRWLNTGSIDLVWLWEADASVSRNRSSLMGVGERSAVATRKVNPRFASNILSVEPTDNDR